MSAASTVTDMKPKILAELTTLRDLAASESAGPFKVRSYVTAIKAIQALPSPIIKNEDLPAPTKGDGLGPKIREKISKILTEGSLSISDDARARSTALAAFQNIYGVGPKKAADLVAAGYTTIAELRAAVAANPKLLNRNQQTGLRYYEPLLERIQRAEMDVHAALLMANKPVTLEGVIVGSYRRGRPDSGDIDMLLCAPTGTSAPAALEEFVMRLISVGYLLEVLAQGDHKCLAIAAVPGCTPRRLDLLVTPPEEFPFAVFYFTGSDSFNVAVRSHALSMGFTLNEHALTVVKTGDRVSGIRDERQLFKVLRLAWVEPPARTGPEALVHVPKA
jgi:DNA polymerase/3'-5' exonuclease PolX